MDNKNIANGVADRISCLEKLAKEYASDEAYFKEEIVYGELLRLQAKPISYLIAKAQSLRNQHKIQEAIILLEKAVSSGFYNNKVLHVLAAFCRDMKNIEIAENYIWHIISTDTVYSQELGFSVFASDILRKQGYINTAYSMLRHAIVISESLNKKVPLTASAMLVELEHQANNGYSYEVSHRFYDAVYEHSEKYASASADSIYVPVWDKICELFKTYEFQSIVDVGCGPGQFAEYIIKHIPAVDYFGFDYSKISIQKASERVPNAKFLVGNAFDSEIVQENKNDVFLLLEVLEHIEQDIELLSSFPTGSSIIFSVPNFDSFGHVRFYLDVEDVKHRFGDLFTDLAVEKVVLKGYSSIFLAHGVKA